MAFPSFINSLFSQSEDVNTNTFADNQLLLTAFLQHAQNATIRIYVTATSGFGHQANTVNIMWSLIAAGFNQDMQVIYDDAPTIPTTIQKLAILIPGLNAANPVPVTINGVTISFITLAAFTAGAPPLVPFGITGGYDNNKTNLANTTNTTLFLKLQPYFWNSLNSLYIRDASNGSTVIVNLTDIDGLGGLTYTKLNYYLPLPQMTQADYAQFQIDAAAKVAPYQAILAACDGGNPNANMTPVYGIADIFNNIEAMYGVLPESVLFNLIAGIAYTQDYSDVDALKKGAIIVVIATVTALSYTRLTAMINSNTANAPLVNQYVQSQDLANRVRIIDYNDVNFAARLMEVEQNPDKILVVKMNGLPSKPFNYLYYKSTLPSVFEGKGTASLVLNLPVPFINLTQHQQVYPTLPLNAVAICEEAQYCNDTVLTLNKSFVQTNQDFNNGGFDGTAIKAIGQFIWKINEDEHPVKTYFASLPAYYHDQSNDKLLKAMFYLLQVANQ